MLLGRSDRGLLAQWWFTVDRGLMTSVLLLMAAGVFISMAASPPVAARIGLDMFHFFKSQLVFLVPAVFILVALSFFTPKQARRAGVALFAGSLVLMVAALLWGPEIKGANRWINIGSIGLQPSEFAKPGFVIVTAWFLAEHTRRPEMPGHLLALLAAGLAWLADRPGDGLVDELDNRRVLCGRRGWRGGPPSPAARVAASRSCPSRTPTTPPHCSQAVRSPPRNRCRCRC